MPNAGGQYYWTSKLAPPRHAPFAAYLTGALAWGGALFTSAAVCLAVAAAIMGCVAMSLPGFVVQSWQVVVIYQAVNAIAYLFNCCGRLLPSIGAIMLYTSLVSFVIITIVVPARTHNQNTATSVFATFINSTGWRSDGIAFIVGLVNSNWAFACLDCATHLAEEVHQPERMIPWAIMGTVVIGFVTGWTFSLAMFFSMGDATELANSSVPILQLFYQALRDTRGAIALESLVIATGFGCLIASHTWQARLAWSFARDRGLPGSRHWASVNTRLDSPIAAHSLSCVVVALLGFLYIGSTTAFNSMITACIVLLYVSYSIPVGYLVFYYGRSNLKRGPFWLGKLGMVANCVLLAWTVFTLVMYSLPYQLPATPGSMNYVSAVYVVVVCLVVGYWRVRGRHTFRIRSDQSAAVQESVTEQAGGASAFEEKHV